MDIDAPGAEIPLTWLMTYIKIEVLKQKSTSTNCGYIYDQLRYFLFHIKDCPQFIWYRIFVNRFHPCLGYCCLQFESKISL
jgi:hypothetical protein